MERVDCIVVGGKRNLRHYGENPGCSHRSNAFDGLHEEKCESQKDALGCIIPHVYGKKNAYEIRDIVNFARLSVRLLRDLCVILRCCSGFTLHFLWL
jgi:hypothetical protein